MLFFNIKGKQNRQCFSLFQKCNSVQSYVVTIAILKALNLLIQLSYIWTVIMHGIPMYN